MIRVATVGDAEAIVALRRRAWHWAYGDFIDIEAALALPAGDPVDRWRSRLSSEVITTFVFDLRGTVAGFASAGAADTGETELDVGALRALYVDPPAQGAGVGSALLTAAEAHLRSLGFRRGELWTFVLNAAARAFYERRGWRPVEGSEVVDPGTGALELAYRREL